MGLSPSQRSGRSSGAILGTSLPPGCVPHSMRALGQSTCMVKVGSTVRFFPPSPPFPLSPGLSLPLWCAGCQSGRQIPVTSYNCGSFVVGGRALRTSRVRKSELRPQAAGPISEGLGTYRSQFPILLWRPHWAALCPRGQLWGSASGYPECEDEGSFPEMP